MTSCVICGEMPKQKKKKKKKNRLMRVPGFAPMMPKLGELGFGITARMKLGGYNMLVYNYDRR